MILPTTSSLWTHSIQILGGGSGATCSYTLGSIILDKLAQHFHMSSNSVKEDLQMTSIQFFTSLVTIPLGWYLGARLTSKVYPIFRSTNPLIQERTVLSHRGHLFGCITGVILGIIVTATTCTRKTISPPDASFEENLYHRSFQNASCTLTYLPSVLIISLTVNTLIGRCFHQLIYGNEG